MCQAQPPAYHFLDQPGQERPRQQYTFQAPRADKNYPDAAPDAAEESATIIQRELALNSLEEILLLAAREQATSYHRSLDGRVQQVLDLIEQDFTVQHSLETLAEAVSLSPSRLSHLFKQEVGGSITNMLLSMRLGQAARLLEFTTESIQHIAEQVGFNSAFYFSRQFHQRFGMSPRAYRAMITARGQ